MRGLTTVRHISRHICFFSLYQRWAILIAPKPVRLIVIKVLSFSVVVVVLVLVVDVVVVVVVVVVDVVVVVG